LKSAGVFGTPDWVQEIGGCIFAGCFVEVGAVAGCSRRPCVDEFTAESVIEGVPFASGRPARLSKLAWDEVVGEDGPNSKQRQETESQGR